MYYNVFYRDFNDNKHDEVSRLSDGESAYSTVVSSYSVQHPTVTEFSGYSISKGRWIVLSSNIIDRIVDYSTYHSIAYSSTYYSR